ncbi:DUF6122 family protein [Flavobacteriaceae bacterium]|nr:DUF6122 family protein [Flavobacteriaceae bacterium]
MDFSIIHYSMHFLLPGAIAYLYSPKHWLKNYLILLATMLVDLDHLLASPMFDANRCSIGFHPLHDYWAILLYIILLFPTKTRIIGIGLLLHMVTDYLDCYF